MVAPVRCPFDRSLGTMPAARKFLQTAADSNSEDVVPAGVDASAWERRMGRQKERRQGTDDLWSRLDDLLVLGSGEFPHVATGPFPHL